MNEPMFTRLAPSPPLAAFDMMTVAKQAAPVASRLRAREDQVAVVYKRRKVPPAILKKFPTTVRADEAGAAFIQSGGKQMETKWA